MAVGELHHGGVFIQGYNAADGSAGGIGGGKPEVVAIYSAYAVIKECQAEDADLNAVSPIATVIVYVQVRLVVVFVKEVTLKGMLYG